MKRRRRQNGFVLLLVLAVLTIAALLSAGIARRSLELSAAAAKKQSAMQRRWGEISCRQAVVNRAEILLRTAELRDGVSVPSLQTTVTFDDLTFFLVLSDEQAKLNLNTVFRSGGLSAVHQAVFHDAAGRQLRLRPDSGASKNNAYAFTSWGQVYDFSVQQDRNETSLTETGKQTTCWGNGQLNINRASIESIRFLCEQVVSPKTTMKFIEMRRGHPAYSLEQILKETDISDADRRALRKVLTDKSRCHSLWLVTGNRQRSWTRLDIRAAETNDYFTFYWQQ